MIFVSTTRRRPIEWSSLPVELRPQIFGHVVGKQKYRTTKLTPYVCVSSEWQDYFERFTFRRLLIDNSQLVRFSKITDGEKAVRLSYIHYLCLRIKLQDYDHPECNRPESHATINWNNQRFTHSLKELFHVLRRWNPISNRDNGLILEITAYSPGDNRRCQDASMDYALHENFQLEEDVASLRIIAAFMFELGKDLVHGPNEGHILQTRNCTRSMIFQELEQPDSSVPPSYSSVFLQHLSKKFLASFFHERNIWTTDNRREDSRREGSSSSFTLPTSWYELAGSYSASSTVTATITWFKTGAVMS
ncbi:hypothetical protein F52700_7465 [Fusarium sp. NRRL 52700]|nr:hypothetical protein F52700_7465 [Fusarium sp. NRRL 52700]